MLEVIVILLLFVLNGFFAMCEIALVSSKRSRLEQEAEKGVHGAVVALKLLNQPERFLSTVQVGITLVGIISGAYGAEAFTPDLLPVILNAGIPGQYAEAVTWTLIVAIITFFSLVIGELVPKTIAMNSPEKITITFSPFMQILAKVTYPIVLFLSFSTRIFLKLMGIKKTEEPPVTEEELKYMIDTGSSYGVIEKEEKDIMKSVITFGDDHAWEIMTQRNEIVWIDINAKREQAAAIVNNSEHSSYPVCDGGVDNVIGTIAAKHIVNMGDDQTIASIREKMLDPLFVTPNTSGLRILETFKKKKIHTCYVIDEYGGVEGMITLHDIIEKILGELPDLEEDDLPEIIQRDDGSWLVDGDISIEKLKGLLDIEEAPNEGNYYTAAGFVIEILQKFPATGDKCQFADFEFEILDMDANRIDKILVRKTHFEI